MLAAPQRTEGDNPLTRFVQGVVDLEIDKFHERYMGAWKTPSPELYRLAERTCFRYDRRCELSETPGAPHVVRRGMPSFYQISKEVIDPTYDTARSYGFEGELRDWRRFVYDTRPKHGGRDVDEWAGHRLDLEERAGKETGQ
jgi:hypothetical protein